MKKILTTILALALSIGLWAQTRDTMFIHTGESQSEFLIKDVDSIIFYRAPQSTLPTAVGSVELDHVNVVMAVGQTFQLQQTVLPPHAVNKNVAWFSSSPNVATISSMGLITAVAEGDAVITVVTHDGDHTATSAVKVMISIVPATGIHLDKETDETWVRGTVQLSVVFEPEEASNKNVMWSSNNENVAKVDVSGLVTGVSVGTATITAVAQSSSDLTASCVVNVVNIPATDVIVTPEKVRILPEKTLQLSYEMVPAHATNNKVTWSSNNENVATVDANTGLVTSLAFGTANITATTEDGNFTASCEVNVIEYPNENNIVTYEPDPEAEALKNFMIPSANYVYYYYFMQMSPRLEKMRQDAGATSKSYNYWDMMLPRSSYQVSVNTRYTTTAGFRSYGPVTSNPYDEFGKYQAIYPLESNPKSDARLSLGRMSTSSGPDPETQADKDFAAVLGQNTGWTIIEDENNTFWFRSIADPNDWFVLVRMSASPAVQDVELNETTATLKFAETVPTLQLKANILPANTASRIVDYTSSNSNVATVDAYGLVTPVAPGQAMITATTRSGGYTATCNVTVQASDVPVTGVSLDPKTLPLMQGKSHQMLANVEPANAINKNMKWRSSDEGVIIVNDEGLITAVGAGEALVIGTTAENGFSDTCEVTVTAFTLNWKNISTFEQNPNVASTEAFLAAGIATSTNPFLYHVTQQSPRFTQWRQAYKNQFETFSDWFISVPRSDYQLSFAVEFGAGNIGYRGQASDATESISILDGEGNNPLSDVVFTNMTRNSTGTGTRPTNYSAASTGIYTAYDFLNKATKGYTIIQDGSTFWFRSKADSSDWFVVSRRAAGETYPEISGVEFQEETLVLKGTESKSLTAHVMPVNAVNVIAHRNLTWKSSDEDVATVQNGIVTAVAPGKAEIIAILDSTTAKFSDTIEVEVEAVLVESVKLDTNKHTMLLNDEPYTLRVTVLPSGATNPNVEWRSSNESVATVANGAVTAVSGGDAIIYVESLENPDLFDSCVVTVEVPVAAVTGVSLNLKKAALKVGTPFTLDATVEPNDAGNKNVTWRSGNEDIATVDATTGAINFLTTGDVEIIVKTDEGDFEDTCEFNVVSAFDESLMSIWIVNPNEKTVEAFQNNFKLTRYNVTTKSGRIESLWNSYVETTMAANLPQAWYIEVAYTGNAVQAASVVTYASGTYVKRPSTSSGVLVNGLYQAFDTIAGEGHNKNCDMVFWMASATSGSPSGASGGGLSTIYSDYFNRKATGGFTVIQDGSNFYFRSKADVNTWFKAEGVAVTGVTLNETALNLILGDEDVTLTATVAPTNAYYKNVVWTSSDESVATVVNGVVHALKAGTSTIKATSAGDATKFDECEVTVVELVDATGVSLDMNTATGVVGQPAGSLKLKATVEPFNAANTNVSWSSSDEEIATVDDNGAVTILKEGTVNITVTSASNSALTDVCAITVTTPSPEATPLAAFIATATTYQVVVMCPIFETLFEEYKTLQVNYDESALHEIAVDGTMNGSAASFTYRIPYVGGFYWIHRQASSATNIVGIEALNGSNDTVVFNMPYHGTNTGGSWPYFSRSGYDANSADPGYSKLHQYLIQTPGASTSNVTEPVYLINNKENDGLRILQNGDTFYFISNADNSKWIAVKRK